MKRVILIVTLLVPAGIFIFLKYFGKNEFSIPVYFETGVPNPPNGCTRIFDAPFLVSDSILYAMGWKNGTVLIVADSSRTVTIALQRLEEVFLEEVQIMIPSSEMDSIDLFYDCEVLLQKPWNIVLVDNQRRIRGYYDLKHRDETDRLIVELKILLKKY